MIGLWFQRHPKLSFYQNERIRKDFPAHRFALPTERHKKDDLVVLTRIEESEPEGHWGVEVTGIRQDFVGALVGNIPTLRPHNI